MTTIELPVSWKPAVQQVTIQRESWDHKIEFLLAVIGYAVDLGNVWRFPTAVYMNGGGAFFIPYFILLIFGGLPLFYMELALGQYHRSGVFTICPLVKGVGWATVLINFMMAMFYNTIISWAVYYLVMSFNGFRSELPWKGCHHAWNTECCVAADVKEYQYTKQLANSTKKILNATATRATSIFTTATTTVKPRNCTRLVYSTEEYFYRRVQEVDKADSFNNLGKIKWELALCLFVVFIFVYFALWKGIKSSGKAVWITAIAPYVILLILLFRGVTLSGSLVGIQYYLQPRMELLKSFSIWNAAATQIFFSLGPGFGVLLALSSYNKFHNNCYRDALITSTINCATSVLAGLVVFSTLGHMADVSRKTIDQVIEEKGSELVFIVYPHTIALMNWSTLWAILFFFMLITLGIDSTIDVFFSFIDPLFCRHWYLDRRLTIPFTSLLFIFPLCFSKTIKFLQIPSMLGVLAIIYVVIIVPIEYFKTKSNDVIVKTHPDSWTDIFLVLPTMCFSYQAHVNAVPVFVSLKSRADCIKATLASTLVLILSYSLVAVCGYLTFGIKVDHDILMSYHPISAIVLIAIIMVAIKTYTAYPVNLFCGRTAIDSLSNETTTSSIATDARQSSKRRILIVCLWFFSTLAGAVFLPNISVAIHYLGALAASFIFTFPGLCLYFHVEQSWVNSWGNIISISIAIFYVAIGVFVTVLTLLQSLIADISGTETSATKTC
ncbi:unnamed protein product [Adineta steineri]|uniref:Transporter n=1 Tax=Adineta steineri TaxID=433720 RepID=A0A814V4E0_9BILA|nr:unnamed protein product [Adineta steineri]